jgi:hypothetical protein
MGDMRIVPLAEDLFLITFRDAAAFFHGLLIIPSPGRFLRQACRMEQALESVRSSLSPAAQAESLAEIHQVRARARILVEQKALTARLGQLGDSLPASARGELLHIVRQKDRILQGLERAELLPEDQRGSACSVE